jgi:hypothetical protein
MKVTTLYSIYEVDYNATDDRTEENFLIWSLNTNATWLSINSDNGLLKGTPLEDEIGWYWVNISVMDFDLCIDFHNFTLMVLPEPVIENNKPRLMNFKITPQKGDTETEFTFTVYYSDADSEPPTIIQVVIDNISYNLKLQPGESAYRGEYEFKTTLTEGEHTYYFTASDGRDGVRSNDFKTPSINKPQEKEEKVEANNSIALVAAIVIIIIIMLILIFLLIQDKKKKETDKTEIEQAQPETQPEIYPTVVTQQVPIQPQQQPIQPQAPVQQVQPAQPIPSDANYYYSTPEQGQPIEQPDEVLVEEHEQPEAEVTQENEDLIEE